MMRMSQGKLMARRIMRHGRTPNFAGFRPTKKAQPQAASPSDAEKAAQGWVSDKPAGDKP